jgi:hypothetical protein
MYRHFLMSAAALTLMTGAVFAQDNYSTRTTTTVTRSVDVPGAAPMPVAPAPGVTVAPAPAVTYVEPARRDAPGNVAAGGVSGAALGAGIGCLATLPIGCAPGAAVGAAIGGGSGAVIGAAASIPPPQPQYR